MNNKKLLGGIAALLVVAAAVWIFAIRERKAETTPVQQRDPRSAVVVLP